MTKGAVFTQQVLITQLLNNQLLILFSQDQRQVVDVTVYLVESGAGDDHRVR